MSTNFEQYVEWKCVQGRFTTVAGDNPPDGFLDHEEDNSTYTEDDAGVFANACAGARALLPMPMGVHLLYASL